MRASVERSVRVVWPVVAGLLLGLLVGLVWTLLQPDRYRAETRVLVRGPAAASAMPAVEALAESSLLEQNVAQTLRLSEPPNISAEAGKGGVLTLSVEASTSERARQVDAEAAQVLTQLVDRRFGSARLEATVLDPAHVVEQTSPTPERNFLIAGLAGLIVGLVVAVMRARRLPPAAAAGTTSVDPGLERRLRKRIDEVSKRERAMAKSAGELAARERALAEQAAAFERRQHELEERKAVPEPEPVVAAEPEPQAVEEPPPVEEPAVPQPAAPGEGGWTIEALERLVGEHRDASPERVEEWDTYLFLLRGHAAIDGSIPANFDSLIDEIFGDIAAR